MILADLLMNSASLPGYTDPMFWAVPAALAAFRITAPSKEPGCILTINGVPQHVLLARLNAKRGLVKPKKPKHYAGRPAAKQDAARSALEESAVQRKYEIAFRQQARWPWRMVQKEARARKLTLTATGLALLAAAVGVVVDLAPAVV